MVKSTSKWQRFLARHWPVLLLTLIWLGMFWPMMTGQTVVAYRDSAYLYYPLFQWIDSVWANGEIPLWNPFDNYGAPVVADGSSSVFYPGKLIFFARFLSYEARYGSYLAIHVWIAAMGGYWFARRLRCSRAGATLSGFSYAFGGSVLFQLTNVIYLVSAAWLPFALCSVWQLHSTGRSSWAIAIGFFASLMILGGDPQMAYHVGLISAATLFFGWLRARRDRPTSGVNVSLFSQLCLVSIQLAIVVAVTFVLSAIQLMPTMEQSAISERSRFDQPRNLLEVYSCVQGGQMDVYQGLSDLIDQPPINSHEDHLYQFSQPPWSVAELCWPNFGGKPFPEHQRWASSLPGADRMWTPTLYIGCWTLLLALPQLSLFGKRRRQVWITRWALFFAVASFGWYGAVWMIREFNGAMGDSANPVGGLYWWMVVLLPKYVVFRYPAKLFVIASLGLCLMAGIGLSNRHSRPFNTWKGVLVVVLVGLALSLLAAAGLQSRLLVAWFQEIPADPIWGPFRNRAAVSNLYGGLLQIAVCLVGVGLVAVWIRRSPQRQKYFEIAVLTIVGIDVLMANHFLTAEVSSRRFTSTELPAANANISNEIPAYPEGWAATSSSDRLGEVIDWQRAAGFPKWHLAIPTRHQASFSSIKSVQEIQARSVVRALQIHRRPPLPGVSLRQGLQLGELPEFHGQDGVRAIYQLPILNENQIGQMAHPSNRPLNIEYSTESITCTTQASRDDLFLCIQQLWDPNWSARILDRDGNVIDGETEIGKWMGVFMATPVPQGDHVIEFRYRPHSMYLGAVISGAAWALLLSACLVGRIRKKSAMSLRKSGTIR